MRFRDFLSVTSIAGLIAAGSTHLKPTQERHREDVKRILESIHPSEEVIIASHNYYDSRDDLNNLSSDKKRSLTLSHARLSVLLEQIKTWGISIQSLLAILKSPERMITDENTKLKIATNFWRGIGHLYSHNKELELWTEGHSPNKILRNFKLSEATLTGGELKVSFSGTEFESEAREDKEQLSASTGSNLVGPATYTLSVSLVLAQ